MAPAVAGNELEEIDGSGGDNVRLQVNRINGQHHPLAVAFEGADGNADIAIVKKGQENRLIVRNGAFRRCLARGQRQQEKNCKDRPEKPFYSFSSSSLIRTALTKRLL